MKVRMKPKQEKEDRFFKIIYEPEAMQTEKIDEIQNNVNFCIYIFKSSKCACRKFERANLKL